MTPNLCQHNFYRLNQPIGNDRVNNDFENEESDHKDICYVCTDGGGKWSTIDSLIDTMM